MFHFWGIQHTFAGLWPLVWHWGTPIGIIILAGLGEIALGFFTSYIPLAAPAVRKLQEVLLAVMICAALFLYGLSDGIKIEHARSVAQQTVLLNQVGSVVDDVLNAPGNQPVPAKKGVVRKSPYDRWDQPWKN